LALLITLADEGTGENRRAQSDRRHLAPVLPGMYEPSQSQFKLRVHAIGERAVVEWFDDLVLGMRFKSPKKRVTREDIKRFASEFDPQAYHLDEAAAELSVFKGLAASGWHTAAIAMRLSVETLPFGPHPLLGLGVDELRWLAPVRPDDVIHLEGEVVELTPSRSKPQGIARVKWIAFNQRGEPVYTFTPIAIVPRRPA
jgi:acyl dehydratase